MLTQRVQSLFICVVAALCFYEQTEARDGPYVLPDEFIRGKDLEAVLRHDDQDNLAVLFPHAASKSLDIQRVCDELKTRGVTERELRTFISEFFPTKARLTFYVFDSSRPLGFYRFIPYPTYAKEHIYATIGPHRLAFSSAKLDSEVKLSAYSKFQKFSELLATAYFNYRDSLNVERFLKSQIEVERTRMRVINHWNEAEDTGSPERPHLRDLVDAKTLEELSEKLNSKPVEMKGKVNLKETISQ